MGHLTRSLLTCVALAAIAQTREASLPSCPDTTQADFDYVVVGAGAGGGPLAARLAESGFSVLVVDAGHDVVNVNTTIPLYFIRATEDPQMELNYTENEYPPGFKFQKDDSWYPRARGVGGSTTHNAMINIISATQKDFDDLAATFNDPTWSRDNMQSYYKRIEHSLYVPSILPNDDHGFDGWLKTSLDPFEIALNPKFLDVQLTDIVAGLATAAPPVLDLNTRASVDATGYNLNSYTIDEHHNRSSVHERLLNVQQSSSGRLQFSLDTLATKVLLCNSDSPTAYGVEIAPGAALPVASNFQGKSMLRRKTVTARHEVIVSAGVYQSPQLLMLSGIGDSDQLTQNGIKPVVHLPGVGLNLQDHDEIAVIWRLKQNFSLFDGCTVLYTPEDDPCLKFWTESGHQNLYSFGPALAVIVTKTDPNLPEPDMLTYFAPSFFRGFVRGFPQEVADNHNAFTAVALKAHPSSKGTVRLTGPHPQDKLDIQKLRFQAAEGPRDVADLRETIKLTRAIMEHPTIALHVEAEVFPGSQAQTDDEIDAHVYENIFGHHACCTNPMGPDSDVNTVLDGDFRVHGVANLRVVDASSFPNVPGFFVTTPIYMISEKAADVIIAAAKGN